MNRRIEVTSSFFQEMQKSKLFFELNVLENNDFEGYDILVNIDTKERIQISSALSDKHYSHKEKYKKAIDIVGIEKLTRFFPFKNKKDLLKNVEDAHLNGKYQRLSGGRLIYDNSHYFWLEICRNKDIYNKIKKLGIINSASCWTSIIKNAMKIYYNIPDDEILNYLAKNN